MSEWYSKYPNDDDEYEITFKSKNKDLTKAVEKVCCAIMDGVVKSRDDVDFLVRGRWIYHTNALKDENGELEACVRTVYGVECPRRSKQLTTCKDCWDRPMED